MASPLDGDIEALALRQNSVFTAVQARDSGATEKMVRHRVRTGRWLRMHPGVFALLGTQVTPTVLVHAAVLAAGSDAVASHTSAAGLLGIPGFKIEGREIHITTASYARRRRTPAVVHGTLLLPLHHRRLISDVPTTSVARTLFDLCGALRRQRAERALDSALARRMVLIPALWRVLDDLSAHGRAGSGVLRPLLLKRGGRYSAPESELEARFIDLTRTHGLPEPDRQLDVGNGDSWIGRVDFAFRGQRVIVECDGTLGHSALLDRRADAERDRLLTAAGWTVKRFGWADVTQRPTMVADSIRHALKREAA